MCSQTPTILKATYERAQKVHGPAISSERQQRHESMKTTWNIRSKRKEDEDHGILEGICRWEEEEEEEKDTCVCAELILLSTR